MAIRADTGSRAVGIARDWASHDGLQAALLHPDRVLGLKVGLLCGVAAAFHRRAGEELEPYLALCCSEKGSATRVVARELTGASMDRKASLRPDLID